MEKFILAITGASGIIYGIRLLEELVKNFEISLILSDSALYVMKLETDIKSFDEFKERFDNPKIKLYFEKQIDAPIASGSYKTRGMFIVPCSMKTVSAIAHGYADNLITRAADVTIKEGRKLVISPREMPFSIIHLENMLKLAKVGVIIAPPVPAFYNSPKNIDDMVNFVVGKLLDLMEIENGLYRRWDG
ncbi:MAG: UbiX family flavin prenyltransferase [Thermodesulfovibrio sp.]|nr:UbiX family flavin prenyltransferase [Thermodesulfovibrio sp.]MCX7723935.1 UbiX family flavin prenyltransferase [Thermodesulfovibrio sp.]MDW7971968.1 flavin prenyltransferase UbiX [Thermodesulfovibrio sp.]